MIALATPGASLAIDVDLRSDAELAPDAGSTTEQAESQVGPLQDPLRFHAELDEGPLGPGRQAYRERRDPARATESYELFKAQLEASPEDPVVLMHLAMSCYYLGSRVHPDKKSRIRYYDEGRVFAELAATRAPDCAPCHVLTGVNLALWGQEVGIFRVLASLPKVMRHLNTSVELDPSFGGAAALRALSQINRVLPRWLGGGKKKARSHLMRAIALAPDEPLNYQFLAFLLLEDFGDRKAAVGVARQGVQMPLPPPDWVESVDSHHRLQQFIDHHAEGSDAQ